MRKLAVIFLFIFFNRPSLSNWRGLSIKSISGIHIVGREIMENDKIGVGALAGWGVEYAFDFMPKNYYLSLELGFPYHNDAFTPGYSVAPPWAGKFRFPNFLMLLFPITYLYLGYEAREDLLLTVGLTYIWGVNASIRKIISDNVSLEIHGTLFIDRIIYEDGYHDGHLSFSFRYLFN